MDAKQKSDRGRMSYESGMAAETRILADYENRGFRICDQRWRGTVGELDLVAGDTSGLIFVEVKQSRSFDDALAHLSPAQVNRLYATVDEYLAQQPNGSLTNVRFDVALVNQLGEFRIIENAFA
jgi:putative endonuclease